MKKSQLKNIIRNIINEERSSSIPSHFIKKTSNDGGGDIYYDPRLKHTIEKREELVKLIGKLSHLERLHSDYPSEKYKNQISDIRDQIKQNQLTGGYNTEYRLNFK